MTLEHTDVQWTLLCTEPAQAIIASLEPHAEVAGWTVIDKEIKDADASVLSSGERWPAETFGSARYSKPNSAEYTLFWSTYSSPGLSKITGGLYIKQFGASNIGFRAACGRALADLAILFHGDDVLCLTLTLEDDGIDIGPGIVGRYRPSLWRAVSSLPLPGLEQRATDDGWIDVRPSHDGGDAPESVFSMPQQTRESIQRIQSRLTEQLWPSP